MVITDKPFPEDRDIEENISGQKYGKKTSSVISSPKQNDILYLETEEGKFTQINIGDYFANDLIQELTLKMNRLEEKILKLEEKPEEYKIQNLLDQNEISRMELENIFEVDNSEESISLEGLLSEFVDKNENSLEMVRSVRDNS